MNDTASLYNKINAIIALTDPVPHFIGGDSSQPINNYLLSMGIFFNKKLGRLFGGTAAGRSDAVGWMRNAQGRCANRDSPPAGAQRRSAGPARAAGATLAQRDPNPPRHALSRLPGKRSLHASGHEQRLLEEKPMSPHHIILRLLLLVAILAAQALAAPAFASCANPYTCLCFAWTGIAVQAKVVAHQGTQATVLIEAVDNPTGATTALAEGSTATMDTSSFVNQSDVPVGLKFLGRPSLDGNVAFGVGIGNDGRVTCYTFRPTVKEALAIIHSANCVQAMKDAGFQEPPCNDTHVGEVGCTAGRGGGWAGLLVLAVGLAVLWRRRRPA